MTAKERFLTAMKNRVPDRVPCTPDISNYIPCKKTGHPYWDIYFRDDPPLWKAYMDAAAYFGIEMWIASCTDIPFVYENRKIDIRKSIQALPEKDAMVESIEYLTPEGTLEEERICFRHEPPMHLSRVIKDIENEWKSFKYFISPPTGIDMTTVNAIRSECESHNQAFGLVIGYPGFHAWEGKVTGSVQTLTYTFYDTPSILDEWFELELEAGTKGMELYLALKPDYICFGGSGTLTLANTELVMRYAIPALKKWSAMAKAAGVPSVLHSCGKSRRLVDMLVEHTDINCINPLECPPMGDVDLAEVKRSHGNDIALMGNLHTTNVMLTGSSDDVYRASVQAIEGAGENGGFILSTGDQCPRDTPDENIFAMLHAVQDKGWYDSPDKIDGPCMTPFTG